MVKIKARKKTTLAVMGGSRAYDLLGAKSFGKTDKKPRILKTPFGRSAPVRTFSGDGFDYYFMSRHGEKGYEVSAPGVNYRANVWALKKLGVERIISWSGPGAINRAMTPGMFVVPHDVIDMTKNRPSNFFEGTGMGFIRMSEPFCPELRAAAVSSITANGSICHNGGVYVCTEGPRLETPAEIRAFASWGADLVGMTLVPEAFLARQMEMCYAAVCLSTNVAEGVVPRYFREGELFEGMMNEAEKEKVEGSLANLPAILGTLLRRLSGAKRGCKCGVAMDRYRKKGLLKNPLDAAR
jgi:5'-methylthioadenosine phosphorylase